MADFNLQSKQHGAMQFDAVQADGVTPATVTNQVANSNDPTIITVGPNPGFPNQAVYHTLKAGNTTITVTGVNGAGTTISKDFTVGVTDVVDPTLAVTFVGKIISQVND